MTTPNNVSPITIISFVPELEPNPFLAQQRDLSPESGVCVEMQGRNIEIARAVSRSNNHQITIK